MFPLDYLLAAALLTSPPETAEQMATPAVYAAVRPTLSNLAVQWEIMDPREVRCVLVRAEDFAWDLKLLQRRYRDLACAPPVNDSNRLPPREAVSEGLAFNRAYRQHLENRQAVDLARRHEVREAIQETDRLYEIWDTVRDARCDCYYVSVRRQALKRLRDMLGPPNYYAGNLPPHVPVWRFQSID